MKHTDLLLICLNCYGEDIKFPQGNASVSACCSNCGRDTGECSSIKEAQDAWIDMNTRKADCHEELVNALEIIEELALNPDTAKERDVAVDMDYIGKTAKAALSHLARATNHQGEVK